MKKQFLGLFLVICLLWVIPQQIVGGQESACGIAAEPRLSPGEYATIAEFLAESSNGGLNLRDNATTGSNVVVVMSPASLVEVLEGPQCVDGLYWYHLRVVSTGEEGYAAESYGSAYYLNPAQAPTETIIATSLPIVTESSIASLTETEIVAEPSTITPTQTERATESSVVTLTPTETEVVEESAIDNTSSEAQIEPLKEVEWTFIVYMAADNNLEAAAMNDIAEMEANGSSGDVNIVVQIDRAEGYDTTDGDWTGTRRYYITKDSGSGIGSEMKMDIGEINTGDPQNLTNFGVWAIQNFPAKHYALIIWDHGGAWTGLAIDDTSHDELLLPELADSLKNILATTGLSSLDLIGFDACLMGNYETYQTIAPYGDIGIASEELIPADGWDYDYGLAELIDNPTMSGRELGQVMIDNYIANYEAERRYDTYTLSMVDLNQMELLNSELGIFTSLIETRPEIASELSSARNAAFTFGGFSQPRIADIFSSADFFQFFQNIVDTASDEDLVNKAQTLVNLRDDVVLYHQSSDTLGAATGMAIFFPRNRNVFENGVFAPEYETRVSLEASSWQSFLASYMSLAEQSVDAWPQAEISRLQEMSDQTGISLSLDADTTSIARVTLAVNNPNDGIVTYRNLTLTDDIEWNNQVFTLSDDTQSAIVLGLPNPFNDSFIIVDGFYKPQDGEESEVQIVFSREDGEIHNIWGVIRSESSINISEISPSEGDQFTPARIDILEDNSLNIQPGNVTFTFGRRPYQSFILQEQAAQDDEYQIYLIIEDISGNEIVDDVTVSVSEGEIDTDNANTQIEEREGDRDSDGIGDDADNCPSVENPDQLDIDNDGIGDVCDVLIDVDNDGIGGDADNCPFIANPDQLDLDNDGIGDTCDDASNLQIINIGDARLGSILVGGGIDYGFTASAGTVINIDVNANYDSIVALLDNNGRQIAFNDDFDTTNHSRIESFVLPYDGNYIIRVGSFSRQFGGDFTLTLALAEGNFVTSARNTLNIGQLVNGFLAVGGTQRWDFSANAGQVLTIDVNGSFDTVLRLLDSSGNELGFNDDFTSASNSRIESFSIPNTGSYTIEVGSYQNIFSGDYRLIVANADRFGIDAALQNADIESQSVAIGNTINGTLSSGVPSRIDFEGQAGEVVTISINAEFDSYLTLYDPSGNIIAEDDDSGAGVNSLLRAIPLQTDGFYLIEIRSYSRQESGSYQVNINLGTSDDSAVTDGSVRQIRIGDRQDGNLALGTEDEYRFTSGSEQEVTISIQAGFDTTLTLLDENFNQIAYNDDFGGSPQSRIERVYLPSTGVYHIIVAGYSSSEGGAYTLHITRGSEEESAPLVVQGQNFSIQMNSALASNLPIGDTHNYTFEGIQGLSVIAEVIGNFDTTITIIDPHGDILATNDDYNGRTDISHVEDVTLPIDGIYTLSVGSFAHGSGGDYEVSLMLSGNSDSLQNNDSALDTDNNVGAVYSVSIGEQRDGNKAESEDDLWVFNGQAGQQVTITMQSNAFDTFLSLYGSNNNLIAQNDDYGSTLNSQIVAILPDTGNYTIIASSLNPANGGSYSISLQAVFESSEPNSSINSSIASGNAATYSFDGQAGQLITVDLQASFDTTITLFDPNGNQLRFNDDWDTTNHSRIEDVTLLTNGTYTIRVGSYQNRESGDFTLQLIGGQLQQVSMSPVETPTPTDMPTAEITELPTVQPSDTAIPTEETIAEITELPTVQPSDTAIPTEETTAEITELPTISPSDTATPTNTPTAIPTDTVEPTTVIDNSCYIQVGSVEYEHVPESVLNGANGGNFVWNSPTNLVNTYSNWIIWENGAWSVNNYGDCSPLGVGEPIPDGTIVIN